MRLLGIQGIAGTNVAEAERFVVPNDDCLAFGPKGSITNRECRKRFKNSLVQLCAALTNRLQSTDPNNRACLISQKMATCHAASVYQPVEP
jgi:hypothetical protein